MKAVILCGGLGTRFSEETKFKPKPMIKIGKFPILFHIMKIYEKHGINEFILALGYKGNVVRNFFNKENLIKLNNSYYKYIGKKKEPLKWNIQFCFSGLKTMTGGRLLRLKKYLKKEENFLLTYGDGLSDININGSNYYYRVFPVVTDNIIQIDGVSNKELKIINSGEKYEKQIGLF